MRKPSLLGLLTAVAVAATSGCVVVNPASPPPRQVVVREPGPPPPASAHGYRRKHQQDGEDLVFDSGLGVYVVVDTPDCWWIDSGYYRWKDGVWTTGLRLSGPWTVIKVESVPPGLRGYKGKKSSKGNGRGNGNPPASWRR